MSAAEPEIAFTRDELMSYLPMGWGLSAGGDLGGWRDGRWRVEVLDGADQAWELTLDGDETARHGRLGALQRAVDRLYRQALGRPTRR